jgi:hypothetical protein
MTTFDTYEELQAYNAAFTVSAFDVLTKSNLSAGKTVVASSDAHYQEAKSFRYNSSSVWDLYSPQASINADQFNGQFKSHNLQAAQSVSTLVNGFTRATNLYAVEADSCYNYATSEYLIGAPVLVQQASKNINYGDYVKIQAGRTDQQRVSSLNVGDSYGQLQLGAVNDVVVTSERDGITFIAKQHISNITEGDLFFSSKGKAAITSEYGFGLKSGGEVSIGSDSSLTLSAGTEIIFNTKGGLRLDAKYINIGGIGSALQPFNLDLINIASDLAQGIVSGDLTSFLEIPDAIGDYTATFIDALPEQLSGVVESATTSLFNSLTPGSLQNFIQGLGTDQWLQNIGGVALGNATANLPQFGSAVLGAIPFLGTAQSAFNRYTGTSFNFDSYPRLEALDSPQFAPVAEPKSSIVLDGNTYAQFPYPTDYA